MSTSASSKTSRVAQFISRRIDELRPRRSQLEIATAAGYSSPNMLSMIKDGKAKLSMEKVASLAKALECEPTELTVLALEQFYAPEVVDLILSTAAGADLSSQLEIAHISAAALTVEMEMALREVRFARQFARNAVSRAERAGEGLARVKKGLYELIEETRHPPI